MRIAAALFFASSLAAQTAIDFSYAGYGGGGVAWPRIPASVSVRPSGGDDTALLQGALDRVGTMPLQASGFRGAVLLRPGRFRVSGRLRMGASGVVLRGSANTVIVGAGTSRRTLIDIGGTGDPGLDAPMRVTDETVPAGSRSFHGDGSSALHPGDRIVITRPSTAEWIAALKMRGLPGNYSAMRLDWTPGSRNLTWDRIVTGVETSGTVTVDAPITTALERRYGGGTVAKVVSSTAIAHVGVEDLILESDFNRENQRDEDHSWIAVTLDRVEDAWVRGIVARHFAGSAVRVGPRARRVTIEDSRSEAPVSEPGGFRRQSFLVEGQQVLVQHCTSEQGMNDFATGLLAGGPNVFLDCTATGSLGPSGSVESWASGVLYERVRVRDRGILLSDGDPRAQGSGYTAANSVIWNCEATEIRVRGPEGAENIEQKSPEPLYATQLAKRNGGHAAAEKPREVNDRDVPEFRLDRTAAAPSRAKGGVQIVGGRFTVDGHVVWGGVVNDGWWRGMDIPATALDAGVSLTRFVPGRTGPGLTEDLEALADRMVSQGTPFYQAIPGLWYDRRRDEHSVLSRTDANVWPPFYEMPWARSGKGTAADGLSLFDLTRLNPWYFGRLRDFSRLAEQRGLVLHYNLYNTHNVLEILPHWVDYPWRPANNVNDTGLPEPPPVEPGNHIHVANQVYDISQHERRELHRALILHALDQLSDSPNVFFCLGFQFAGPLSFQEFFQDTVAEWEKAHAKSVRLEMATSKDITDAILANPQRARQVAVIDMRYWEYRPDGSVFAPAGGRNLAFREMISTQFPGSSDTPPDSTPLAIYRQVREYHDRYPDKAVIAWHGGAGPIPVLMAGGAEVLMRNPSGGHGQGRSVDRTVIDGFVREYLSSVLMKMEPRDGAANDPDNNWCLADAKDDSVLFYSLAGTALKLKKDLSQTHYYPIWFDPRTGKITKLDAAVTARAGDAIPKPSAEPWLVLLRPGA